MQDLRKQFEAYGGDYQATMGRFMGNEALYLKLLKMFFQDENLTKLGTALETEDLTGAFEAAHTLKGVAGNLGLTPLYQSVYRLVEALRTGVGQDDYKTLYRNIQDEADRVRQFWDSLSGAAI